MLQKKLMWKCLNQKHLYNRIKMSQKRQKEIIDLLTQTLVQESLKPNGGNSEVVEQLTKRLEKVKNWKEKVDE